MAQFIFRFTNSVALDVEGVNTEEEFYNLPEERQEELISQAREIAEGDFDLEFDCVEEN